MRKCSPLSCACSFRIFTMRSCFEYLRKFFMPNSPATIWRSDRSLGSISATVMAYSRRRCVFLKTFFVHVFSSVHVVLSCISVVSVFAGYFKEVAR